MPTGRQRGFNASKEGFVTAPPVAVSPGDPANALLTTDVDAPVEVAPLSDDVIKAYDAFSSISQLPESRPAVFVEERGPRVRLYSDLSDEVRTTADIVCASCGVPEKNAFSLLPLADSVYPYHPDQDLEVIDPDMAASWVSTCMGGDPDERDNAKLIASIRSGEVVLTRRELATLTSLREIIDEQQAKDSMDYAGGSEWVPFVETRRCTLCGEFIGQRSAHSCDVRPTKPILDAFNEKELKDAPVLPGELFVDGEQMLAGSIPKLFQLKVMNQSLFGLRDKDVKKLNLALPKVDLTTDELTDLFNSEETLARLTRTVRVVDVPSSRRRVVFVDKKLHFDRVDIAAMFLKKKMLSGFVMELPTQIRKSMVEKPVSSGGSTRELAMAAATIEPPFQRVEIERMINEGGARAAVALLGVKRTRELAGRILANYPSNAGGVLAVTGNIPSDVLSNMVTAGDPLVRRTAATAPNLSEQDLNTLMSDPDEDVRMALLDTDLGFPPVSKEANKWTNLRKQDALYNRWDTGEIPSHKDSGESAFETHPNMLMTLVNDPSDKVVAQAFLSADTNRMMLLAINGVTSRRRLAFIKETFTRRSGDDRSRMTNDELAVHDLIDARLKS